MATVNQNPSQGQPTEDKLAKRAVTPEVITNPTEFKRSLAGWQGEKYHILTPQADFGALPPQWTIVPSIVLLNPDPNAGEVYRDQLFCRGDEVAPTKIGLRKIARAGGISWRTERTDSGTVPNYWSMSAEISYRGFDGQIKTAQASYEWDLRDGGARTLGMSQKELTRARMNGYRRCEAGAINAAIREYGLKQKYTKEEIAKPFVVLNLVFNPDMSDPQQKAAVLQSALTNTALLFPSHPSPLADKVDHETGEIFDANKPEPEEKPFDEEPAKAEPPKGVVVEAVSQKGDDYFITIDDGKRLHTKDRGIASACNTARKDKIRIPLVADTDNEIIEIESGEKL